MKNCKVFDEKLKSLTQFVQNRTEENGSYHITSYHHIRFGWMMAGWRFERCCQHCHEKSEYLSKPNSIPQNQTVFRICRIFIFPKGPNSCMMTVISGAFLSFSEDFCVIFRAADKLSSSLTVNLLSVSSVVVGVVVVTSLFKRLSWTSWL